MIITLRPATIPVAPPATAATSAVNPVAKAANPVPAAKRPAPIPSVPAPIRASAPERLRIDGTSGVRTAPAMPITVNAPAILIRPFAIASQLMEPRAIRTGVRTAKAPAATIMAAEPDKVPFITFRPNANSAKAPPIAMRPFTICSGVKFPNLPNAFARISNAAPTAINPVPILTIFFGMKLTATATSVNAAPIASIPCADCPGFILPNADTAEANIFIAAAISINASPVETICLAFPAASVKAAVSAIITPMPVKPTAI